MNSVTWLDTYRARGQTQDPDSGRPEFSVDDLVGAMDDHTRALLARGHNERRASLVPRCLAVADLVALSIAYFLATLVWAGNALGSLRELSVFALTLPCWIAVASLHGLYKRDQERADNSTTDDMVGVFHLVTIGVWLLFAASHLAGYSSPGLYSAVIFWTLAICLVPLARTVARAVCRHRAAYEQNAVILGAGEVGQLIGRKLVKHPEYGVNVVGFIDRDPKARRPDLPEHLTVLGPPERLPEIIEHLGIERVIVAFSNESEPNLLRLLRPLRDFRVQIDLVPRLYELVGPCFTAHSVEGIAMLGIPPSHSARVSLSLKRAIDVIGALVGLAVLSPLLAFIALRIHLDSEGPVLFRQKRLGTGMREFTALKFRTMKVGTDPSVHEAYIRQTMSSDARIETNGLYKLERADCITPFGSWLRRTSLDELPQLINVLKGDMSLVGPRPCIAYETENFDPHHFQRFAVPQGITGLWQVTARAHSTYGESLDMDVAYARNWSLGLDLRLLLRTPLQVLRQRSATA